MSEFSITILDTDFVVEYSTRITSRPFAGRGPDFNSPGEPPEPGEFEVKVETLRLDRPHGGKESPELELPAWLNNLIAAQIHEDDGVYREVFDGSNSGPDPDDAYNRMRTERDARPGDVDYLAGPAREMRRDD